MKSPNNLEKKSIENALFSKYEEKIVRRFERRFTKFEDRCWIWYGGRYKFGYGKFDIKGKTTVAHRVSWEIYNGAIHDTSLCVLHKCDEPSCVNPSHLFLGTKGDNSRDMAIKGRAPKGTNHPNSKLFPKQIKQIRRLYKSGTSKKSIGLKFGTTRQNITHIINKRTWNCI